MGKLKWSFKASKHLHAIFDYIAQDSKTYASRFIKSLIQATRKLEKHPYCGRIVPELESYGFREVLYKNYRIIYRVLEPDGDIEILAVIHGARDLKSAFREDWDIE